MYLGYFHIFVRCGKLINTTTTTKNISNIRLKSSFEPNKYPIVMYTVWIN